MVVLETLATVPVAVAINPPPFSPQQHPPVPPQRNRGIFYVFVALSVLVDYCGLALWAAQLRNFAEAPAGARFR